MGRSGEGRGVCHGTYAACRVVQALPPVPLANANSLALDLHAQAAAEELANAVAQQAFILTPHALSPRFLYLSSGRRS